MSALFLIARANGRDEPERFARLSGALSHRGPDGFGTVDEGWLELGHRALWTTPEEIGERQPLVGSESGLALAWCGRLDNREELLDALGGSDPARSDAALILAAWERWAERSLARILGPFALAVADLRRRTLVLARDPLGDRGLVWAGGRDRLVAATEEAALLAEGSASATPEDRALARLFALAEPDPSWTFFRDIVRLPPGGLLRWRPGAIVVERWWDPPSIATRRRSDREHAAEVRGALERAVAVRLRGTSPAAVMMSGGLDSTSVAALTARLQRSSTVAVSWMFDELAEADEREWIHAMGDGCGLDHVAVPGDREWPLRRLGERPVNPNAPVENLYCGLVDETYRQVVARGSRVVLNGELGDELYAGSSMWLRDLVGSGRWLRAAAGVARRILDRRGSGWSGPGLRIAVSQALGRRAAESRPPARLTPLAAGHWAPAPGELGRSAAGWERTTSSWNARFAEWEARRAAQLGVEVRRPYRDRRLIELFLSLPADQLYRPPWTKWVTRRAMRGILPDRVRRRTRPTTLMPLAVRGLEREESAVVRALLGREDAWWPRYLRRDWLLPAGRATPRPLREDPEALVGWLALTVEVWRLARQRPEELAALAERGDRRDA